MPPNPTTDGTAREGVGRHREHEGDEPALSKLSDLEMLVITSSGRERTAEELGELFAAAGLRLTRVVPTTGTAFVLEATPVSLPA